MQNRKISNGFRAMNTDVLVTIAAEDGRESEAAAAIQGVKNWFDHVEATLSRFKPESELSRLNASAGLPYAAGPMLREVLRLATTAVSSCCPNLGTIRRPNPRCCEPLGRTSNSTTRAGQCAFPNAARSTWVA